LRDWRYAALAFTGGLLTFLFYRIILRLPHLALAGLDAVRLSLFAVAGAEKALSRNVPGLIAALLGTITAVGGGTVRDVLLMHVPAVLRVDIYARAALLGAVIVVVLRRLGVSPQWAGVCGFFGCFILRLVSVGLHWHLPVAA
jgi:uncharacterized membrane protein YeiH